MSDVTAAMHTVETQDLRRQVARYREPRTGWERFKFVLLNVLLMPMVVVIYVTINAEGLRSFIPFFGMPLWRVPGFEWLQNYVGWNQFDLGHVTALGLLCLLSWFWSWVVKHLRGSSDALFEREHDSLFFWVWAVVSTVMIGIEAAVFFAGLVTFGGGLWSGGSWWTAAGVTVLYMVGMFAIAVWHNKFKFGGE